MKESPKEEVPMLKCAEGGEGGVRSSPTSGFPIPGRGRELRI